MARLLFLHQNKQNTSVKIILKALKTNFSLNVQKDYINGISFKLKSNRRVAIYGLTQGVSNYGPWTNLASHLFLYNLWAKNSFHRWTFTINLRTGNTNFEHEVSKILPSPYQKIPFFSLVGLYFKNCIQIINYSILNFANKNLWPFAFSLVRKYLYYIDFASWPRSLKCFPSNPLQKKFVNPWSETKGSWHLYKSFCEWSTDSL